MLERDKLEPWPAGVLGVREYLGHDPGTDVPLGLLIPNLFTEYIQTHLKSIHLNV